MCLFRGKSVSASLETQVTLWNNKMMNSLRTTGLVVLISVYLLCLQLHYAKLGFGLQSNLGLADIIDLANM